ncbi:MAG: cytochrome c oxidase assembly protein [Acidobacteriota bacterium]
MTTWDLLASTWSWEPSILGGCVGLLGAYFAILRSRASGRSFYYVLGVVVLLLALVSPIDTLGEQYLFSIHMLQHMLLVLVVPPLLLLGIPAWVGRDLLSMRFAGRAEHWLSRPVIAWTAGVATLWIWHLPILYNAALVHQDIHILEHESFLVTATIFWWPVVTPVEQLRLPPLSAIVYLSLGMASESILGIILTFAPVGFYPSYLHPFDTFGALSLVRQGWGISAEIDQQVGGLLMWIGGSAIFLIAILGALNRWYATVEEDEEELLQAGAAQLIPVRGRIDSVAEQAGAMRSFRELQRVDE